MVLAEKLKIKFKRAHEQPRLLVRWGFAWGRGAFSLRSALAAFDVHVLPWAALKEYFIHRKQYNDPEQTQTELNGT